MPSTETGSDEMWLLDYHIHGYCHDIYPEEHYCFCDENGAGSECTKD
jgi:hypothetical protein